MMLEHWRILFLVYISPALVLSMDTARRDSYQQQQQQKYSEWRQLWYPNFEEFSRAEAMAGAENNTITNVTVQLGATAYLHCHVRSTGDRTLAGAEQVSWVRRRDWHILSSGVFTYTNDERFQILHAEGSDDWTLQIKYVQKRDNGTYECQVSTSQGLISHFVNLQIVVPEATIQGTRSGEHHVDIGSIIDLVCIIERSPTPPQYVFWYHNDHMINYDTARGGISVETVPGPRTQSRLTIRDTNDADSGNYTCSASNTEPASIYVFVSEGDNVDAILMRKSCAMCITSQIAIILISMMTSAMR
ncbi:neuronal growth regulator 1-like [Diabrotica virgifera virgifera]|uniref:Ig-like domain-containing protein n=1 Tax=Diabrotica virgifera virgifera TaxID=50390 RepID=A0ABM5K1B7_DIAVI|nr:neuronal growth regulator 1-like [Diabrotica virgifera virgifera]XP_050503983.1 neuronal growth regulator 1-like [Diabrotica virgifera virgifera]